jgi:hypothetical protein
MPRLLLLAAIATLGAGCDVCGLIDQDVIVAPDDPDLGGLISDCRDGVPPATAPTCQPDVNAPIDCACVPLCERVYAIVNPDPHRPSLQRCTFGMDAMGRAQIEIEYRSVCE